MCIGDCYELNCVPPKFIHSSEILFPIPQTVTLFRDRVVAAVNSLDGVILE